MPIFTCDAFFTFLLLALMGYLSAHRLDCWNLSYMYLTLHRSG